jgi:hypothetical protein
MRLAVKFSRAGNEPVFRYALNDAVVHQGAMARLVGIDASSTISSSRRTAPTGSSSRRPRDRPRTTWPPAGRSSCPDTTR